MKEYHLTFEGIDFRVLALVEVEKDNLIDCETKYPGPVTQVFINIARVNVVGTDTNIYPIISDDMEEFIIDFIEAKETT